MIPVLHSAEVTDIRSYVINFVSLPGSESGPFADAAGALTHIYSPKEAVLVVNFTFTVVPNISTNGGE